MPGRQVPRAYHWGPLAVQERVGVRELAEHVGRSIGTDIRDVAAAFLGLQPHLVVGAEDAAGRMWASLLTGPPGFVRATGPDRITVAGGLPAGDPLSDALAVDGTRVGTIALDSRTRRRMRLNGTVEPTGRGFAVRAEQVFANCPKFLQKRQPLDLAAEGAGVVRRGHALTPGQERAVRAADTFFVSTTAEADDVRFSVESVVEGVHPGRLRWSTPEYSPHLGSTTR